MRRLICGIVILAALAAGWWLLRPTPGGSLFADWDPHAVGKVWTIVGAPDSPCFAFVDPTGALQPRRDSYSIHYFIYDRDSRGLCSSNGRCRLDEGCVPVVSVGRRGVSMTARTFVDAPSSTCVSTVSIANTTKSARYVSLFVVAVPNQLTGPLCTYEDAEYDRRSASLIVGGRVLVSGDVKPMLGAAYGANARDRVVDISGYVRKGFLPRSAVARGGPSQVTSGAMRYDVALEPGRGKRLVFRAPMEPVSKAQWGRARRTAVDRAREGFERQWGKRLGRVDLQVPDSRCEECFRASVMYLLLLSRGGRLMPGPTKYGSFWVRDCAYMADALYYAGQSDLIPPAMEQLRSLQLSNGGFRARAGAADDELDAPGEAIYALVQQYRRTSDIEWLGEQWGAIERACRYVQAKRGSYMQPRSDRVRASVDLTTAFSYKEREQAGGILPASVSAEDLGKGNQQHYWDDFWCIRGLRDAAFAARALGKKQEAVWIAAEAESLADATRKSIEAATVRHRIAYIPNGPDEVTSSAMARGTSCALWPCGVFDAGDPLVRKSFDAYWSKWIAPSGGGFVHKGHYWPYAGLDLAQGYLMMGQRERAWEMLDWTLDHDPTRGLGAWPEGMFTKDLTLAEGDMPHGWMCAAYVSMVRNMLVRESGRDLVLMSGVPREWLKPGNVIAVRDFPTEFGKVSYRAEVVRGEVRLTLSGAHPPGAYRIDLPGGVTEARRDAGEVVIDLE